VYEGSKFWNFGFGTSIKCIPYLSRISYILCKGIDEAMCRQIENGENPMGTD